MDKKVANEYANLISEITGQKSPRSSEEIAVLFESGKHEVLDVLELSQYAGWLAGSGQFDRAEHIANSIQDASIQQRTLAVIAQRMIASGILDKAKILLDRRRTKPPDIAATEINARVELAQAHGQRGNTELASAILTETEELIKPEGLEDFERAEYLFVLANGWLIAGDQDRSKQLYIEAFDRAQRSFETTQAAGGNGYDERRLSLAIIRRLVKSGMLSEANHLTSLIADEFWRHEANALIAEPGK